jgi:hypothetical protein
MAFALLIAGGSMRTFRDLHGTEWTVFEVRRPMSSGKDGDWSYLPSGFNNGWLCFENPTAKRRLTQYPERWRESTDEDLEKLLRAASPAPRTTLRLGDDLGDSPTSRDAR